MTVPLRERRRASHYRFPNEAEAGRASAGGVPTVNCPEPNPVPEPAPAPAPAASALPADGAEPTAGAAADDAEAGREAAEAAPAALGTDQRLLWMTSRNASIQASRSSSERTTKTCFGALTSSSFFAGVLLLLGFFFSPGPGEPIVSGDVGGELADGTDRENACGNAYT